MQTARRRRGGSASAATIERAERERKAIALRNQGWSFDEIAIELGFADRSGARKAVERGLSRWMRETDEELRARELERTEMVIDRLMPLIDREEPELKAVDRLLRTMDHRAKITGLYNKRPALPDTYPGAPNRAAEDKADMIERYSELAQKLARDVFASGYGSGVTPYDDEDEEQDDDAMAGRASDSTDATAELDDEDELVPQGKWIAGKWVLGNWIGDRFVPADENDRCADPNRSNSKEDAEVRDTIADAFRMG